MTDFRIAAANTAAKNGTIPSASIVESLIHQADDIAKRFQLVAATVPYRTFGSGPLMQQIAEITQALGAATWQRIGEEVPSYSFAEDLGQDYRREGATVGVLMLHWQILRRAIHLVLANCQMRTGHGGEMMLREMTMMNYIMDRAIEASVVGYVIAEQSQRKSETTA